MIGAPTQISHEALDAMAEYWLFTLGGSESDLHGAGDVAAINLLPPEIPPALVDGFSAGVTFGIRAAAAVLSDPFGNPSSSLQAAVDAAGVDTKRIAEYEEERRESDRRAASNARKRNAA